MVKHHDNRSEPAKQTSDRLPTNGYAQLQHILDLSDYEPLFDVLRSYNRTGRKPYPVEAMWRAVLCRYLLTIRYQTELVQRLRTDPRLRELCGLGDRVPSESMLSRFFGRLTDHHDLVHEAYLNLVDRVARCL